MFRQLGTSLDLAETLSTLDAELRRLVRYDTISVHLVEDGRLTPAFAAGPGFQVLASLEWAVGEGLLGEVAATGRPAFNALPSRFPGPWPPAPGPRHGIPDGLGGLAMALAVGIEWRGQITAVLAIYRAEPCPFAVEDLQLLEALAPKLAVSMDNARRFGRAQRACARALFERLDAEVARSRRVGGRLAVLECMVPGLDFEGSLADRLAGELRRLCREYDFVACTGNSFVVVLADFAPAGMTEKLARIEAVFRRTGLAAAIGAAFQPEDGEDADRLLAAAHGAAHA
jgi:hypothetical protein